MFVLFFPLRFILICYAPLWYVRACVLRKRNTQTTAVKQGKGKHLIVVFLFKIVE